MAKKVKKVIEVLKYFPVIVIREPEFPDEKQFELDKDLVERYEKATREFWKLQEEAKIHLGIECAWKET